MAAPKRVYRVDQLSTVDELNRVLAKIAEDIAAVETGSTTVTGYNTLAAHPQPWYLGTSTDHTLFESDGTLRYVGAASTWEDVYPSSVTIGSGGSAPSFTAYNGNLRAYEFVGTGPTTRELNMGFQLVHARKDNSDINPHLHLYIPNDATGGSIRFGCEYTWTDINQLGSVSTTTVYATTNRTANAGINNNAIIAFGPIKANKGISSVFMCRIFRDPTADTFNASVWLKSADVHVEIDSSGSRSEFTK